MPKYFYSLGHVPQLGLNEYLVLSANSSFLVNENYLLSDTLVDITQTGSLIYSGEILGVFDYSDKNKAELPSLVGNLLKQADISKVGLALPMGYNPRGWLQIFKSLGYKKINIITGEITFGHFKQTKEWFQLFKFKDKMYFGKITARFDQQLWRVLDDKVLKGDMSRGLINLKLARSMANLVPETAIWDPFCGVNRNLVAAIDLKENFFASDIDAACLEEAKSNFEAAHEFLTKNTTQVLGHLKETFECDASNFKDFRRFQGLDIGVVTEGFLGTNYTSKIPDSVAQLEFEKIFSIWLVFLKNTEKSNIRNMVFCLPFYPELRNLSIKMLQEFIDKIAASNWQIEPFESINSHKTNYILYKRDKSIVAHALFRLTK